MKRASWVAAGLTAIGVACGSMVWSNVRAQQPPFARFQWVADVYRGPREGRLTTTPLPDRETDVPLPPDSPWECYASSTLEDETREDRTMTCRRDAAEVRVRILCSRQGFPTGLSILELNGRLDAPESRVRVALRCTGRTDGGARPW